MRIDTKEDVAKWSNWIGAEVYKRSDKPFKSGKVINTVTKCEQYSVISEKVPHFTETPPMVFYFKEDDSFVECWRCRLVVNESKEIFI